MDNILYTILKHTANFFESIGQLLQALLAVRPSEQWLKKCKDGYGHCEWCVRCDLRPRMCVWVCVDLTRSTRPPSMGRWRIFGRRLGTVWARGTH